MLISIIGGLVVVLLIFSFILINNLLNQKKQLYNELYQTVLNCCNSIVTKNSSIEDRLKEGVEEGINADSYIITITKKLYEVMKVRDKNLYLKISKSNAPKILGNILVIIRKYRSIQNITIEQENILFDKIYDCIKKPNIGLIAITKELNAI